MEVDKLAAKIAFFPKTPGIYKFFKNDTVIYVGKAKNIKKRTTSYTNTNKLSERIRQMVFYSTDIEFITTLTEEDALILESKLIKEYSPKYNILLKDDKDYPFILITTSHDFPKIMKYRGKAHDEDFKKGPFVSSTNLYLLIKELSKMFQIRTCSDYTIKTRKRPCIEYFIKRCSAPCVNYITKEDYNKSINDVINILNGNTKESIDHLTANMKKASLELEYEKAALIRDQIKILSSYIVQNSNLLDTHIIIHLKKQNTSIVKLFIYKNNINYGTKDFTFFEESEDLLTDFIKQFYYSFPPPKEILLLEKISNKKVIEKAYKTRIKYLTKAQINENFIKECILLTNSSLENFIKQTEFNTEHLTRIKSIFGLQKIPQKIEIIDNSHFSGKNAFAVVVVFENGKFKKTEYRAYKIQQEFSRDDYQMMREIIQRRYSDYKGTKPDLLIIDGGLGQFNAVIEILKSISQPIDVISIAKGVYRNAFDETFFSEKIKQFKFLKGDKTLFFLERLRDEAHNFAISTSRKSFEKTVSNSELQKIRGLTSAQISSLLEYFKDIEKIKHSTLEDLMHVPFILEKDAKKILKFFSKYN